MRKFKDIKKCEAIESGELQNDTFIRMMDIFRSVKTIQYKYEQL
jgi:hypothetical protein